MNNITSAEISGWGRYPRARVRTVSPQVAEDLLHVTTVPRIARGQGRSYGDAALLTDGLVVITDRLKRIISWDTSRGLLTAEAGTTFADILSGPEMRGWFPSVVPGTKTVSLGGAVAADIHGKNHHHAGSFGAHATKLEIMTASGEYVTCRPDHQPELFWATIGGMGLTGIITQVTFEMIPTETEYMIVKHRRTKDLDAALELCESADHEDQYSVLWLDCVARSRTLGRGVFTSGHHAQLDELPRKLRQIEPHRRNERRIPFDFPSWLLNRFTVGAFDDLYHCAQAFRPGGKRTPFVSTRRL